jgi:hypothetical protein
MLSYRQRNIPLRRYRFTSAAKAAEGSNSLSCIAEAFKRPLGWRLQAIAAASLVLLFTSGFAPATAAPEDSTAARSISTHELDAMLKAWFAPLPRSAAVEIFSKEDRPKRSREEWETLVREGALVGAGQRENIYGRRTQGLDSNACQNQLECRRDADPPPRAVSAAG